MPNQLMWKGFEMGSSDEIHGCYAIVAHIRVLARWVREDFGAWIEAAMLPQPMPGQAAERDSQND